MVTEGEVEEGEGGVELWCCSEAANSIPGRKDDA
jgi:hypothetical protein